ncbi:hypothetical protein [Fluviicola taffensis]|uniref:Lipoprotein n=1 Tax=Fluviicola taffensis (strain DSM 16823 / NCIMB 13979 / RW262) TaxID=755732 RepID=F2IG39_FLUTR|nr:hypothetical protein [Fluviicola taffensis]AEA44674.1 hypothetical protein Fluta_2693 [Fluviicola taffensis DSM 16823]
MKNVFRILVGLLAIGAVSSCGEKEAEKVKVDVAEKTPDYKAYDLVQNLKIVKDLQEVALSKNQKISLQLRKDLLNGSNGYYWFQVVQEIGPTKLVKLNVKVRETTFKVTILDDNNGADLTPEEYAKKYPVKKN